MRYRAAILLNGDCLPAFRDVAEERRRQLEELGFDAAHDDGHMDGELAAAAASYALSAVSGLYARGDVGQAEVLRDWLRDQAESVWPFRTHFEGTTGAPRVLLVRAAALLLAEIERLDRNKAVGE